MTLALDGKTALVTGGSRGIGRAIAQCLAAAGAAVAVHYNTGQSEAAEVVSRIESAGGRARAVHADLSDAGAAEELWSQFDDWQQEFDQPGLDILVNNAALAISGRFETARIADLDYMYAVNVRSPFVMAQQAVQRMRDGGRIVNISSAITRLALTDVIAYGLTKGAIDTFTLILAKELGPREISVNAVAPGYVDTEGPTWLSMHSEVRMSIAAQSAFGRIGAPDDIADVVLFLASDAGRWVTGQVIDVSGGTRL